MATRRTRTTPAKRTPGSSKRTTSKKKAPAKKMSDSTAVRVQSVGSTAEEKTAPFRKMRINGIVAGILLLVAAGIFFLKDQVVVALVNGQPVWRTEVIQRLETQSGQEVLDGLVMQKLLDQEARKQGVTVTPEDLDGKIAEIEESVTSQGQDLEELLELQGMTRDDLKSQLRYQVLLEKLIGDSISVSDEEIDDFIQEQKEFLEDNPDMSKVREDVRNILREQKMSEEAVALTERLRTEAAINFLREY